MILKNSNIITVLLSYEVFFASELVPGSKVALFFTNLRYQALTQR